MDEFLSSLRALSPRRFEEFSCDLLEYQGYKILERPSLGPDGGVDIIARIAFEEPRLFEEKWVVQCKWSSKPDFAVGFRHVAGFPTVCTSNQACGYLLMTNGSITTDLQRKLDSYRGFGPHGYLKAAGWFGTVLCDRVMTRCVNEVGLKWFPEWARRIKQAVADREVDQGLDHIMDAMVKGNMEEAKIAVEEMRLRSGRKHA
ncbi:MAG: restriction endonuclease [Planctomycetes bacterium]|nr:restriction endonuclease [Planctomycetota bacterium]MCW8134466.1 restriction endonuclease [Planctomycetota bacterium]